MAADPSREGRKELPEQVWQQMERDWVAQQGPGPSQQIKPWPGACTQCLLGLTRTLTWCWWPGLGTLSVLMARLVAARATVLLLASALTVDGYLRNPSQGSPKPLLQPL